MHCTVPGFQIHLPSVTVLFIWAPAKDPEAMPLQNYCKSCFGCFLGHKIFLADVISRLTDFLKSLSCFSGATISNPRRIDCNYSLGKRRSLKEDLLPVILNLRTCGLLRSKLVLSITNPNSDSQGLSCPSFPVCLFRASRISRSAVVPGNYKS